MKKITHFVFFIVLLTISTTQAQLHRCGTMPHYNQSAAKNPAVQMRMNQTEENSRNWIAKKKSSKSTESVVTITIPVVVHVIHQGEEIGVDSNISDEQILSQIQILNNDFRSLNIDAITDSHPFWPVTVDTGIDFCMAKKDPNGKATNGITRTKSKYPYFNGIISNDTIKSTAKGGRDNWDPTKYLNIWLYKLSPGNTNLGYATFPSELATEPQFDGVAIRYDAFGISPNNMSDNNLGRTATHEVGHWLNLRHIWGDENCGDDLVDDTVTHEKENYGCPTFPHSASSACVSDLNGEMYMNYMDYVDDNCMNMFTNGQANRMRAALSIERVGLLTSTACSGDVLGVGDFSDENNVAIYPNPTKSNFMVNAETTSTISVYNLLGVKVLHFNQVSEFPFQIDIQSLQEGTYIVKISSENQTTTKKIVKTN